MKNKIQAQRTSGATTAAAPVSLNLTKGASLDLMKENPSLDKVAFACGWDAPDQQGGHNFDIDLSMIMLDKNGKLMNGDVKSIIYFNNLKHTSGSITHTGDNLTGAGDGDDETVNIDLKTVPAECDQIVGIINIFEAKKRTQHFGQVKNAFARIYNRDGNTELGKYELSGEADRSSLTIARIYRKDGGWSFEATGDYTNAADLNEIISRYQ